MKNKLLDYAKILSMIVLCSTNFNNFRLIFVKFYKNSKIKKHLLKLSIRLKKKLKINKHYKKVLKKKQVKVKEVQNICSQ